MFKSKRSGVLAAAAVVVGVLGSAPLAHASDDSGGVEPQSDIIAVLKSESMRKAGGDQQDLSVRKAGGYQHEYVVVATTGGDSQ